MDKTFASDNYSGVHSRVMEKLMEVNSGHAFAYGEDPVTREALEKFKEVFGDVKTYFVYNGTGANVLALEAMKGRATTVICPSTAHIFTDEAGAPSKITGMQLLPVPSSDGKLDLEKAREYLSFKGTYHRASPNVISITQATENGTIYTLDEVREISKFAVENNMYLHMDGARLANACASLGCTLKEMTAGCGVDVLSFGGTKNGLMFGEAIVFFNKDLARDFLRLRKQNLQLHSKMRYIAAQYLAILEDDLWLKNAKKGNEMAAYLRDRLLDAGVEVVNDVKGNTVFAILDEETTERMQEFCYFYVWDEMRSEVRFVMSYDIEREDIDQFIEKLKELK